VASLAEGRQPDFINILGYVLPFGVCLAATWSIGSWRAESIHIVVGNLGRSPIMAVMLLTAVASPAFLMAPGPAEQESDWVMTVSPDKITVNASGQRSTIQWEKERAVRQLGTSTYETTSLRAPIGSSLQKERPFSLGPLASALFLFIVLWVLAFRRKEPGFFPTLMWGATAYAVNPVMSAILAC